VLTIGEVAERAGVATSALRYYDELGLLPPAARVSGRRRYTEDAVARVGAILLLSDVGFTLAEVGTILASRRESPTAWHALADRGPGPPGPHRPRALAALPEGGHRRLPDLLVVRR
jgi:DNA-binding transcriptional MerR regulator